MSIETNISYPGKELEVMSFAVNYHRWIIDEFEPYLGRATAEVGAGLGSVSKLLLGKEIEQLFAFEPSRNLYPLLKECGKRSELASSTISLVLNMPGMALTRLCTLLISQ